MPRKTKMQTEGRNGGKEKSGGQGHDIIVIGASVGGVEALIRLVGELPIDLPAAVFIVLHIPSHPPSLLPGILSKSGPLPASHAIHGEVIKQGRIYVAPSDSHMMLQEGFLRVVRGPRENGHRPAVDPLFRTAAHTYGARVIGVVLTGALDCGTSGLLMIKSLGGLAVVQDPQEAFCADMPQSAIDHVKVDHVLPVSGIGPLLNRLAREPVKNNGVDAMAGKKKKKEEWGAESQLSPISCPECSGSLIEEEDNDLLRFRCHVGHAYTAQAMISEQAEALEAALWTAVRTLEESEMFARRMASRSDPKVAPRFSEKADALRQHAEVIRSLLLNGETITLPDAVSGKTAARRRLTAAHSRMR